MQHCHLEATVGQGQVSGEIHMLTPNKSDVNKAGTHWCGEQQILADGGSWAPYSPGHNAHFLMLPLSITHHHQPHKCYQ